MQGFHNVLFPLAIAFGSTGGPERRTDVVPLASGYEDRNQRWADSRRRYNAATGIRSLADLSLVTAFFEARRGRLYGFRWRDVLDWQSGPPDSSPTAEDQFLGEGDGTRISFQLLKSYGDGSDDIDAALYQRIITKPVAGTVVIAVDGDVKTEGTDFVVDEATGLVRFETTAIPATGQRVTAGFQFDVPVRFDTDILNIDLAAFDAGDIAAIPLLEIKA